MYFYVFLCIFIYLLFIYLFTFWMIGEFIEKIDCTPKYLFPILYHFY